MCRARVIHAKVFPIFYARWLLFFIHIFIPPLSYTPILSPTPPKYPPYLPSHAHFPELVGQSGVNWSIGNERVNSSIGKDRVNCLAEGQRLFYKQRVDCLVEGP